MKITTLLFSVLVVCNVVGQSYSIVEIDSTKVFCSDIDKVDNVEMQSNMLIVHSYNNANIYTLEGDLLQQIKLERDFRYLSITDSLFVVSRNQYGCIYSTNLGVKKGCVGFSSFLDAWGKEMVLRDYSYPHIQKYGNKYIVPIRFYNHDNPENVLYDSQFYDSDLFAIYEATREGSGVSFKNTIFFQPDSIYLEKDSFLPHLINFHWFLDRENEKIYLSQEGSHEIFVYEINNEETYSYGGKGAFFEEPVLLIKEDDLIDDLFGVVQEMRKKSYRYGRVYFDADSDLTLRTYHSPEKGGYNRTFLQLYQSKKLVLDTQLPDGNEIINMKGNKFWSVSKSGRSFTIHEYDIIPLVPHLPKE